MSDQVDIPLDIADEAHEPTEDDDRIDAFAVDGVDAGTALRDGDRATLETLDQRDRRGVVRGPEVVVQHTHDAHPTTRAWSAQHRSSPGAPGTGHVGGGVARGPYTPGVRTIVATAPNGAEWRVRVVWVPRWRVLTRRFGGWRRKRDRGGGIDGFWGSFSNAGDDLLGFVVALIVMLTVGAVFWFVLLPLLLLVVDVLVVGALLAVGIPTRVLSHRPWQIEAVHVVPYGTDERFMGQVTGWRAALRTRDQVAEQIRRGDVTWRG